LTPFGGTSASHFKTLTLLLVFDIPILSEDTNAEPSKHSERNQRRCTEQERELLHPLILRAFDQAAGHDRVTIKS